MMDRSSRASPPAALTLDTSTTNGSSKANDYFSYRRSRLDSASSTGSYSTTGSAPSPPAKSYSFVKPTPTVNVHTTCGRHSDQLLFSGPSLTGLAKAMFKKH